MQEKFKKALEGMWDKLDSWVQSFISNLPNIILAILVFVISVLIVQVHKKNCL